MIAGPRVEGLAQVCRQGVLYLDMNPASILIRSRTGIPYSPSSVLRRSLLWATQDHPLPTRRGT